MHSTGRNSNPLFQSAGFTPAYTPNLLRNEGSYQYGYWQGSNTGPQNNSTLNNYPTFSNDTCSLSNSSTLSSDIIMPAVTNTTSCQDGWYNGFKVWCNNHSLNCVQNITSGKFPEMMLKAHQEYQRGFVASNGSYNLCPINENAAFCLGFNSNLGDRYGECGDSPLANISRSLIGCPEDIMTSDQIGGLPILVGKWNFVNQSSSPSITGTFLFNNDGYMKMTLPSKTGLGNYTLEASWGTPYFSHSHHIVTLCYANGGCDNNTLTTVTPNHIEFIDIHHNIIHLMRYHALPPFTLQLVPPQRNATLLYQQGQTQFKFHNYTGALSLYNQGLAIDPHNVNILAGMGQVLYNLQNNTGAIQYLDKALAVNPNDVFSLEFKGFVLNELHNYSQALVYLDRALKLNPSFYDMNRYNTLNTKGLALMGLGDYEQALSTFDTAINAQSYMDEAHYDKAFLLTTLGFHTHNTQDLNTALENVNEAIKFNSDNTKAQALKGLLMQILGGLR